MRLMPSPLPLWAAFGGDHWADISACESHRRDECVYYMLCLARAATENWRGFSCITCEAYAEKNAAQAVSLDDVSIGTCPICETATINEPSQVLRDGWCRRCGGYLEGTSLSVSLITDQRSRIAERIRREELSDEYESRANMEGHRGY